MEVRGHSLPGQGAEQDPGRLLTPTEPYLSRTQELRLSHTPLLSCRDHGNEGAQLREGVRTKEKTVHSVLMTRQPAVLFVPPDFSVWSMGTRTLQTGGGEGFRRNTRGVSPACLWRGQASLRHSGSSQSHWWAEGVGSGLKGPR